MSDNLENLLKTGLLKKQEASKRETSAFLAQADRNLSDAQVPGVSAAGRFGFAYAAAHDLALAAMRANGFRPSEGAGHRAVLFQSLVHTVGAPAELGSTLNRYHTMRNRSEYFANVDATDGDAEDLLRLALELRRRVVEWLRANRADLMP